MVHAEMCDRWGYEKLHKAIEKHAMDEMHHAEWLIERILFLEGSPIVSKLNPIRIGTTVPDMIQNDKQSELEAVKAYNDAIGLAGDVADESTADLLVKILMMEEDHVDWGEKQEVQIEHMGLDGYLSVQTEGASN